MDEHFENDVPDEEAADIPADIPRLVIMDKRLLEALELLGVKVYE